MVREDLPEKVLDHDLLNKVKSKPCDGWGKSIPGEGTASAKAQRWEETVFKEWEIRPVRLKQSELRERGK